MEKNEHYVPRCYLKNFSNNKKRLFVFDKVKMQVRENQSIENVASENHFYDIDFFSLMKRAGIDEDKIKKDLNVDNLDFMKEQFLEKHFAQNIEGDYSNLLNHIISVYNLTREEAYHKVKVLNENQRLRLSVFLSFQVFRTKEFREFLIQMHERGTKTIIDKMMKLNNKHYDPKIYKMELMQEAIPLKHAEILMDNEMLFEFSNILYNHIWIIGVNKTTLPLYTSDHPIVKNNNSEKNFLSHNGFASEGIEISFPISSNLVLFLLERSSFKPLEVSENKFIEITDKENIIYLNSSQVYQSNRQVYCCCNDFSLAKQMCKDNPELTNEHRDRFTVI